MTHPSRRTVLGLFGAAAVPLITGVPASAAPRGSSALDTRIRDVTGRPEFAGSTWGMGFTSADTGEVAGGDLLLSGRMRPDGTMHLPEPDPTYPGGSPLPDPLQEIRKLARQVSRRGVRRVEGRVVVDVSMFAEARENIALGNTMVTVSPMMVDEHLVHVTVTPGHADGAPAHLRPIPATPYVRFTNQVTTGPAQPLAVGSDVENPDGTRTVTVTGGIPPGGAPQYLRYFVPSPSAFAAALLTAELHAAGVRVQGADRPHHPGRTHVAELVSAPLHEQTKVMLKASSNVHTVTWPYLVGAVAGRDSLTPKATYERFRRTLFTAAGLPADPAGAADGRYYADTFTTFLAHLSRRPYFAQFREALPIMGRDGSLAGNQPHSPAAGHVYAKTGSGIAGSSSGGPLTVHNALAGFIELPSGRWLTFAQFMTIESTREQAMALAGQAQEAMAEIATAVHEELR